MLYAGFIIIFLVTIIYFYKQKIYYININKFHISNLLIVSCITMLVCLIIIFPRVSFDAASSGINLWFNTVLPALLPFFIGSELLIGLGFVNFLGALFEPFMRKIFNVPGCGSFAVVMGMTSGYPTGAKVTANLREKQLCTKTEAERLLTFTNNSGPLFIIGAVAVGMFNNPQIGYLLAVAHYLAAITVGFLFRFYKKNEKVINNNHSTNSSVFRNAFREMFNARKKDGRNFGALFGDSVKNSMNLLLMVGGFITFFSVLISMLTHLNILSHFTSWLHAFLKPFGIDTSIINSVLSGIFELTLGCKLASVANVEYIKKIVAAAVIIGWAGFSVHFQVMSLISKTDINPLLYLCGKFIQSIIAGVYTYILFSHMAFFEAIQVFKSSKETQSTWFNHFINSSEMFIIIMSILIILSIISFFLSNIKYTINKKY